MKHNESTGEIEELRELGFNSPEELDNLSQEIEGNLEFFEMLDDQARKNPFDKFIHDIDDVSDVDVLTSDFMEEHGLNNSFDLIDKLKEINELRQAISRPGAA